MADEHSLDEQLVEIENELEAATEAGESGRLYTNSLTSLSDSYSINIIEKKRTLKRIEKLAREYAGDGRKRKNKHFPEIITLYADAATQMSEWCLEYNKTEMNNTALLEEAIRAVGQAQSLTSPWITKRDPAYFKLKTALREAKGHYIGRTVDMMKRNARVTMPMLETAVDYIRDLKDPEKALELGMLFGPNEEYGLFEDALIWANKEGKGALLKLVMGFVQSEEPMEQSLAPYIVETALDVALPDVSEFLPIPEVDQLLLLKLEFAEMEYLTQGILGSRNESVPNIIHNLLEEAKELDPDSPPPMKFQTALSTLSELARLSRWVRKRMSKPLMVPRPEDAPPTPQEIVQMKETRYLEWQKELNKKAFRGEKSDIVAATTAQLEAELWKRRTLRR